MTGGVALVLGEVGLNFAAGMSGGVAYVYDRYGTLASRCNTEMVKLEEPSEEELAFVKELIVEHVERTSSPRGIKMLYRFDVLSKYFVKVIPTEYERVLRIVAEAEACGKSREEALEAAFEIVGKGN